jgi:hypothetical protein
VGAIRPGNRGGQTQVSDRLNATRSQHAQAQSSHPFTGWTSLITLSKVLTFPFTSDLTEPSSPVRKILASFDYRTGKTDVSNSAMNGTKVRDM